MTLLLIFQFQLQQSQLINNTIFPSFIIPIKMNITFFTKSWPRHNYNGHLEKTISLIESLINLNHSITICTDDTNLQVKEQIKQYPMELVDINPKKISLSLNAINKNKVKSSLFIFDSVESQEKYSAFLYNRWNKCSRVLTINQLSKFEKWRKTNYGLLPNVLVPNGGPMAPQKIQDIFTTEQLQSIHRCDYILTGNQYIYHLLHKHIFSQATSNKSSLSSDMSTKYQILLNYGFPLSQFYGEVHNLEYRPYRNRKNFVFIGNFDKQSNKHSIFILLNNIWPLIRSKLPEAELHIYGTCGNGGVSYEKILKNVGPYPNLSIEKLKKSGVVIKGIMKDPQSLAEYRALLHPNTHTTGPHLKIIQSWFVHLPVVTTPVGAQGLFFQSYDPQYTSPSTKNAEFVFSAERTYTKEQRQSSQKIKNYYNENKFDKKFVSELTFGGSCENFTYTDFVENAIKLYTNEQYWNKCLENCHKIIKKNQNDRQHQIVLKKALVNIQMATYQGRGRQTYEAEWKRYTKSAQFAKKLKS